MKKFLSIILAVLTAIFLCKSASAADTAYEETYTLTVNEKTLALDDLPVAIYKDGDSVMVPLRKIGEALGYKVDWDPKTKAITIEDNYVQKATLFNGTTSAVFEGKLQIINMSRSIENPIATVIHEGYTYVPLSFFNEFLNDTTADGGSITVTPQKMNCKQMPASEISTCRFA